MAKTISRKTAVLQSLIAVGAALVVLVLAMLFWIGGDSSADSDKTEPKPEPTAIESTIDDCEIGSFANVGDDGHTLTIATDPYNETRHILKSYCAFGALDMPDAVVAQVENTTALTGAQAADWDGYEAHWTYHPDNGLGMVITEAEAK